eukprot:4592713-Amphidinium_carterae.1
MAWDATQDVVNVRMPLSTVVLRRIACSRSRARLARFTVELAGAMCVRDACVNPVDLPVPHDEVVAELGYCRVQLA